MMEFMAQKTKIILSGARPEVRTVLQKGGIVDLIGEKNMAENIQEAMEIAK